MTFTKGIGTPIFMSPEVLKKEHYKKPADIYSFAITMFETMGWKKCYTEPKFKFPWKIAEFVEKGNRLNKPSEMNQDIYSLITQCWQQDPKERITIDQVITQLQSLLNQ